MDRKIKLTPKYEFMKKIETEADPEIQFQLSEAIQKLNRKLVQLEAQFENILVPVGSDMSVGMEI